MSLKIGAPEAFSPREIALFKELVRVGGQVDPHTLDGLVARARALVLLVDGEKAVATAALKRPNASYKVRVFDKAKTSADPAEFSYELGWVHVEASQRGRHLSGRVVMPLLPDMAEAGAFATSRVSNEPMHRTLSRLGFVRDGEAYPSSEEPGVEVALFLRPRDA